MLASALRTEGEKLISGPGMGYTLIVSSNRDSLITALTTSSLSSISLLIL